MADRYVKNKNGYFDTQYLRNVPQSQIDGEKKRFATPPAGMTLEQYINQASASLDTSFKKKPKK